MKQRTTMLHAIARQNWSWDGLKTCFVISQMFRLQHFSPVTVEDWFFPSPNLRRETGICPNYNQSVGATVWIKYNAIGAKDVYSVQSFYSNYLARDNFMKLREKSSLLLSLLSPSLARMRSPRAVTCAGLCYRQRLEGWARCGTLSKTSYIF